MKKKKPGRLPQRLQQQHTAQQNMFLLKVVLFAVEDGWMEGRVIWGKGVFVKI